MDFRLNEDQEMIRKMVRDFAEEKVRPGTARRDEEGAFIHDLLPGLAELGLLGVLTPSEYGGSGLDNVSYAVAVEELARVCPSTAVTVSVTNSVCQDPILLFGNEAQKKEFLPPLARGEWLGGFALTEPGAGSDASNLKTRAEKRGDRYILNGSKAWITHVVVGKVFVAMAVTDPAAGSKGISAFLVTPDLKGFHFGEPEKKMGLRASLTGSISFEECEVPADRLLSKEGDGLKIALKTLDASRIGIAAQSVGIAQGAFEEAMKYATSRQTFGKNLADHGAIQAMLADMGTWIEAGRLMTYRAAAARDAGDRDLGRYSSMAKLYASEAAKRVCDRAVQIHGAYGYSREYPVERFYRDARVTTIYEGTSEVQRMVIARSILRD